MTDTLPLSHSYNLGRLGQAGDTVRFAADAQECAAIAQWSGVLSVQKLDVRVEIKKLGPARFGLDFTLEVDVTQACVVTLEPVPAHRQWLFSRELEFVGAQRHKPEADSAGALVLDSDQEEGPEEIQSLHYDLAAPALEEYVLSLEPYPRRPGVAFVPQKEDLAPPQSPFAVLKDRK
ncbi:MAG TPA: hypothetical protein VJS47_13600 [Rhizomicrobium sp.]|nr:hypothetical protein [Rhizomicrobium sp.]